MKSLKEVRGLGRGAGGLSFRSNGLGKLQTIIFQPGQGGQPSMDMATQGSRIAQGVMTKDDKEYWAGDPDDPESCGASFCKPYKLNKSYADQDIEGIQMESFRKLLKRFIMETVDETLGEIEEEEGYSDMDKEEPVNEFSAVGGGGGAAGGSIRGHQGGGSSGSPYIKKSKRNPV